MKPNESVEETAKDERKNERKKNAPQQGKETTTIPIDP